MAGEWIQVAKAADVPPGERIVAEVGSLYVAVFNVGGQFYAIEDVCTHDGNELASGELDGHAIECPRHGARFDVRSGAVLSLPAVSPVPSFPIRIEGEDILVQL